MVELVLMCAIAVIIVGALASSVYLVTNAIPTGTSSADALVTARDTLEEISAELYAARSFTVRTAKQVEFTVADRNGDVTDETIRYEWSGTAGDPLQRRYNNGPPVNVLENVHEFGLRYTTTSLTRSEDVETLADSGEILLASFDGWPGVSSTFQTASVSPASWITEYFSFSFPPGALNPRVTRVRLRARIGTASNANYTVGIHRPVGAGTLPEATPLGTPATASNAVLTTAFNWVDYNFSDVALSSSDWALVIVVKGSAVDTARVGYLYAATAPADSTFAQWTTNSGSTWSPSSADRHKYDVYFYAYGAYQTRTTNRQNVTRYFVTGVQLAAQVGADSAARVSTSTNIVNTPEVAAP